MGYRRTGGCRRWAGLALVTAALALAIATPFGQVCAGQTAAGGAQGGSTPVAGAAAPKRVPLDRVVATVNGDLILESDVDAEQRMMAFQPYRDRSTLTRGQLINRLIDRDLILQQMQLQPEPPITDAAVDAELALLRKGIPECAAQHCETDAGWERFVASQGFTLEELRDRWRQRMDVLRFIEQRFRMGIHIEQAEIDDYYNKTLVQLYWKQNATPPPEASVADRIQEILLQQQVNSLMDDWLKTLRAQGSVRMLEPGEERP
ncbi:MAG: peptidylprolyl isomerase [Acidobacteriaceae bacterium]